MPPLPLFQRILVLFTIGCVLGAAIAALVSLITKIPWDKLNGVFIDLLIFGESLWYRYQLKGTERTILTAICVFSLLVFVCDCVHILSLF